jgi:hypothetical protein
MQKINKNIDHIAVIDTKTKKCFRCHKNDVNYLSGRFQGVNSTYFWTSKQLKLLKENFENKTNTEILNLIKLPLNVIKNKAKFFKLKRSVSGEIKIDNRTGLTEEYIKTINSKIRNKIRRFI